VEKGLRLHDLVQGLWLILVEEGDLERQVLRLVEKPFSVKFSQEQPSLEVMEKYSHLSLKSDSSKAEEAVVSHSPLH